MRFLLDNNVVHSANINLIVCLFRIRYINSHSIFEMKSIALSFLISLVTAEFRDPFGLFEEIGKESDDIKTKRLPSKNSTLLEIDYAHSLPLPAAFYVYPQLPEFAVAIVEENMGKNPFLYGKVSGSVSKSELVLGLSKNDERHTELNLGLEVVKFTFTKDIRMLTDTEIKVGGGFSQMNQEGQLVKVSPDIGIHFKGIEKKKPNCDPDFESCGSCTAGHVKGLSGFLHNEGCATQFEISFNMTDIQGQVESKTIGIHWDTFKSYSRLLILDGEIPKYHFKFLADSQQMRIYMKDTG